VRASRILLNDANTAYDWLDDWTIGWNPGPLFIFLSALFWFLGVCAFPTSRWSTINSSALYYIVFILNVLVLKIGFYAVRPILKHVTFLGLENQENGYTAPAPTPEACPALPTASTSLLAATVHGGPNMSGSVSTRKNLGSSNKFCTFCGFEFPPESNNNFCGSCGKTTTA
jgi:hypothetical protein